MRQLGGTSSACSTVVPIGSSTANSSPPTRATSSAPGTPPFRRGPISCSKPVAGLVAERVVELLEVVEVDQQQRQLGLRLARSLRGVLQAREQPAPVRQPRQRVVIGVVLTLGGELAQLELELAAVGRVAHVEHVAGDGRVVQAVGRDDVEMAVAALRRA